MGLQTREQPDPNKDFGLEFSKEREVAVQRALFEPVSMMKLLFPRKSCPDDLCLSHAAIQTTRSEQQDRAQSEKLDFVLRALAARKLLRLRKFQCR
jgi:hypothetical protein